MSTKVKTVVSDDWGRGKLVVEFVFANDFIGFACLEDGEGAVPGSQENPAIGGHGRTSIGLGVKALLIEWIARQGIQAKNGAVLFTKVQEPSVKEWRSDVGRASIHSPKLPRPTLLDSAFGFREADNGNAPILGRGNHQQALTCDWRGNKTKSPIVLILRVESGDPPEFLPRDRIMTNTVVVAMSNQDIQLTLAVSRRGCV